ncbi:MAG: single-stranded-DNA-specific exonuclease RecJ [Oscillospiraceae bacterium]|nr:single-stranded-DNA-specific exonuclease RecJ [Oscillospiraceae bacterium]
MLYRKWDISSPSRRDADRLSARLGTQSLLAKVLLSRGIADAETAKAEYFSPAALSDPFLIKDMDKAVRRIWRAINDGEKIVVYGDYDVDGVCRTATLFSYLENRGANVFYKLPNRETEGYGLNRDVLKKLHDKGVSLVITVDNGIAAIDEVDFANGIGLDVIITDHHLPKEKLPDAVAVIDPLRKDDDSPCKILAGVGVAFKLVCALEGVACEEMLDYCRDYVCVGTVADLMLLKSENRTMVKAGLEMLNDEPRCGFRALLTVSGSLGKTVTGENISFTIAPRINRAGRMSDATAALELLLSDDDEDAMRLAEFLESENKKRQETQNKIAEDITAELLKKQDIVKDSVMVVWGETYHPGVVGIVASKLVETYSKPAIVFTKDGDCYKGSGRSVPGFSLHNALVHTADYLITFGGHELAAGLTIEKENLVPFTKAINEFALQNEDMSKVCPLNAGCLIAQNEMTVRSVERLGALEPFGNGNGAPHFTVKGASVTAIIPVSDGKHLRIKFRRDGAEHAGIMFNVSPAEFAYDIGDRIDICLKPSIFEATSGPMVSIQILEVRPVGMTDKMIDDYDVYRLFENKFRLSRDKKRILRPDRADVAAVYRKIASTKVPSDDLRPLFVALAPVSSAKIQIAIDVLLDLGLIEIIKTAQKNYYAPVPVKEKKDLMSSKILLALQ